MTIQFKTIRYKNFLASGQQFIEIPLDQAATTLILGVNGTGKSTLLDAVCFALFKKAFRKLNIPDLVNEINNADCVVEVEFSIGKTEYLVSRGISPNFLKIVIDGEPRKQDAAKKDDQAFLEQDVLKVDYDAFTQVVILGNAHYTPFMQLKPQPRRDFIEHILDIGVFSAMNDILKLRVTDLKKEMNTIGHETIVAEEQIVLVESFVSKLEAEKKKATKELEKQIAEHEYGLSDFDVSYGEYAQEILEFKAEIKDADDVFERRNQITADKKSIMNKAAFDVSNVEVNQNRIRAEIKKAKARISFYEETPVCSTCGQDITETHRVGIVTEKQKEIAELETKIKQLEKQKEKTVADGKKQCKALESEMTTLIPRINEIEEVTDKIAELVETQADLNIRRKSLEAQISTLKKMLNKKPDGNIQEQVAKLDKFRVKLNSLELKKKEALETSQYYDAASIMLKDTGIKSAIIRQYLPSINKLVNKYLTALDFFVTFTLDENFSETIKSRGRDSRVYTSFSEGEKLRMDLALLFTWREIAHLKNSCSTNLLILDEVIDGSMDANGTDLFIKLLNENLYGSNVFVISHKGDIVADKFKDVLHFVKDKNFSKLLDENFAVTKT